MEASCWIVVPTGNAGFVFAIHINDADLPSAVTRKCCVAHLGFVAVVNCNSGLEVFKCHISNLTLIHPPDQEKLRLLPTMDYHGVAFAQMSQHLWRKFGYIDSMFTEFRFYLLRCFLTISRVRFDFDYFHGITGVKLTSQLLNRASVSVALNNVEQCRAGAVPVLADSGGRLTGKRDPVEMRADAVGDEKTSERARAGEHGEEKAAPRLKGAADG